ncbi:MAG: DUF4339 domain-containing protein [Candidatus Micrarchaeaceae archaeon]
MAQQWYYSRNGQQHGPISEAELKQLAAVGKLKPTDMIWQEGMDNWVSAGSVKGLFLAAQAPEAKKAPPPLPEFEKPPSRSFAKVGTKPLKLRILWIVLLCIGADLLLVSFVTPWWRIAITPPGKSDFKNARSVETLGKDLESFTKIMDENKNWYEDHIGKGRFARLDVDARKDASLWLWGWSTGAGILALVFSLLINIAVILPIFLTLLRPWLWIASFASAIQGLVMFILSLVWIIGSPSESAPPLLSQGVILGPYLVLLASLLLLVAGIVDGIKGVILFVASIRMKTA